MVFSINDLTDLDLKVLANVRDRLEGNTAGWFTYSMKSNWAKDFGTTHEEILDSLEKLSKLGLFKFKVQSASGYKVSAY